MGLELLLELCLADRFQVLLRPDAQDIFFANEQTQLSGQVQVAFIVRRRRQQDAAAFVCAYVIMDRPVTLPLTITQVVAFINDHDAVTA